MSLKEGMNYATLRCKVALVGSAGCGKTSLLNMASGKWTKFAPEYAMTRGVNIVPFPIRLENRGLTVELLVYDTSGQDVYQDQWPKHYAGRIAAMVLVFDLNDAASFRQCQEWLHRVRTQAHIKGRAMPSVLVGAKSDVGATQVADSEVEAFAADNGLVYMKASCRSGGDSYRGPFQTIAEKFADSYESMLEVFANASS